MPRRPFPALRRACRNTRGAPTRRAGDAAPNLRPTRGQGAAPDLFRTRRPSSGFQNPASGSRPRAATRAAQKRPARQTGPEKCCRRYAAPHGFHPRHPLRVAHLSRQQNLSRQHTQINKGGLLPGQRAYEFRHVLRRVEHEHARRLTIQPETVGQPCRRAPAASWSAGVAGRVTANAMPSVTSPLSPHPATRLARSGRPRGNAPAVKANVAASARRHISATEPKRDAARAPPRAQDVAKNGDRSNLTAAPIREQAVGRCHVMPCREPIHGQRGPAPRGLGRLQQLTHGARAFLRNLRYPPPRQARGADTTLRVRIIRACPARSAPGPGD